PVLVNEIFSTVLSLVETQLKRDRITLKKHIPPDLPKILAQPQQIEQVLLNIISNSRHALNQKYEGAHKDKIIELLGEKVIIEKKPFLRIAVLDHGSGIPTDMLDKVLNPFFSSKPADQGTGLGLSISHGIITDHNGKMSIESMEGKFTRVVIDLPADEKGNEE
ncbi:MAG TPA: PAS domain-containing sensor histidine kinase, partial [Nitrospirae bacterium]|nr:PAS domain-containing sensor histidine kinase [Nitrospirota bacterium]